MTTVNNTTLYVGVTNNLIARIAEHKSKKYKNSFTFNYNIVKLVYYEPFSHIESAITREKQLKAGSRKKKEDLIASINAEWNDLYESLT